MFTNNSTYTEVGGFFFGTKKGHIYLLWQVWNRVNWITIESNFIMEMRSGGKTTGAHKTNYLSLANQLVFFNRSLT